MKIKIAGIISFVLIWFLHLLVGAGAFFAVLKLGPERKDKFAFRLLLLLHVPMIHALMAIVLLFLLKGVTLTWKFTAVWFGGALLADVLCLPMILLLVRGLKEVKPGGNQQLSSGDLDPDFWRHEFRLAIKDTVAPEFLKPE